MSQTPAPVKPAAQPGKPDLASQIKELKARTAPQQAQVAAAVDAEQARVLTTALGYDLEFDVKKFITQGIVEKKNLEVIDGLFADMHTLAKWEDVVAEKLVTERGRGVGIISLSKEYFEAKSVAMLTMSLTRLNNALFTMEARDDDDGYVRKLELHDILMKMPGYLVNALVFIYENLDKADAMTSEDPAEKPEEESQAKKSATP